MKKIRYIFVFVLAIFFSGCKKYPDGGLKRLAKKHLIQKWDLVLYEVNGIDSTNLIYTGPNPDFKNGFVSFTEVKDGTYSYIRQAQTFDGYFYSYDLSEDKNLLNFGSRTRDSTNTFCTANQCLRKIFTPLGVFNFNEWKIVKLKRGEMNMTLTSSNNYLIKLKCN